MATYTNQSKNISSYGNGTEQTSSFSNQSKSAVITGIMYNSAYVYNDSTVSYAGIASFSNFTDLPKN